MTTTTMHPLAAKYLRRLEREARRLPRGERRELVEEIAAHLSEAIDPDMLDADALTVLDRLGAPEDIVQAERPETLEPHGLGLQQWAAILLLAFGGFLFFVGWFAGVLLLWTSRAWTVREKLIGTLVVPGGLATLPAALVITSSTTVCSGGVGQVHCTGGPSTIHTIADFVLVAFLVLGPIFSAVYLTKRAR